jgi:uncharacterized protein with NRDE domain
MCITLFYLPEDPKVDPLFISFNREESALRLTEDLHRWDSDLNIIAGRDVVLKGTWFGVNTKTKNIAFLTNLIDPLVDCSFKLSMRSRGDLIRVFLQSDFYEHHTFDGYLDQIISSAHEYNPFNPVFGNYELNNYYYLDIVKGTKIKLPKNQLLGFSNNHAFTNSWPKVDKCLHLFSKLGRLNRENLHQALQMMKDGDRFGVVDPHKKSSIFMDPYFDKEKLTLMATVSHSFLSIENGKGEFHEHRIDFVKLEKTRKFILNRKCSLRLRNYFLFILFLSREPAFESSFHLTQINFQYTQ